MKKEFGEKVEERNQIKKLCIERKKERKKKMNLKKERR